MTLDVVRSERERERANTRSVALLDVEVSYKGRLLGTFTCYDQVARVIRHELISVTLMSKRERHM